MSGLDKNEKKIHAADVRRTCETRAYRAVKEKPTEKAEEIFRRKAYTHESHKKTNADGIEKGNVKH